jgi:hypothetical protein
MPEFRSSPCAHHAHERAATEGNFCQRGAIDQCLVRTAYFWLFRENGGFVRPFYRAYPVTLNQRVTGSSPVAPTTISIEDTPRRTAQRVRADWPRAPNPKKPMSPYHFRPFTHADLPMAAPVVADAGGGAVGGSSGGAGAADGGSRRAADAAMDRRASATALRLCPGLCAAVLAANRI